MNRSPQPRGAPVRSDLRAGACGARPGTTELRAFTLALAALVILFAVPVQAGDPAAGRKKAGMCRTCHGLDGVARIPIAPHIAGESEIYLATQLKAFRSGKREHEIMSVVAKGLSDEDIADLSAWYASIEFTVTMPEAR